MRIRLVRQEEGFTLPEMMVTIVVMLVVLSALYSIFDTSLRVFSFGNNKVEAVENARLGLEKMEREIRAAYPRNKAGGCAGSTSETLLNTMSAGEIAFGNDTETINNCVDTDETIRYRSDDGSGGTCGTGDVCRLVRSQGGGTAQPVVEFVLPPGAATPYAGAPSPYTGGLRFTYLDQNGAATATESAVRVVRIELDITVDEGTRDEGTQTLTTEVTLRNRG